MINLQQQIFFLKCHFDSGVNFDRDFNKRTPNVSVGSDQDSPHTQKEKLENRMFTVSPESLPTTSISSFKFIAENMDSPIKACVAYFYQSLYFLLPFDSKHLLSTCYI